MRKVLACGVSTVSAADAWRSAAWVLGGSLVLTVFGILLRLQIGPNALSEGLLYSAFPAALMLSTECTYLKPYSRPARLVMSVGSALLIILMMWAAVLVADRI
jgi:hypothetical protein